jgi:hypothetical protein
MEINNVEIYGLEESVVASSYPMSTKTKDFLWADEDDIKRANKLAKNPPGAGHNCFLKGVIIQADITATIKWWVQWGRYHFADIVSSCSTMHKLKDMKLNNSYCKWVDNRGIEIMKELQENYNNNPTKENFYKLVYTNPDGMELTARITTNYLQEKPIHNQRKNHKLKYEWGKYCNWIEGLPHSEWITENGS